MYPEGAAACGKPSQEQVYPEGLKPVGRTHSGAEEECAEKGRQGSRYGLTATPDPQPLCTTGGWPWVKLLFTKTSLF